MNAAQVKCCGTCRHLRRRPIGRLVCQARSDKFITTVEHKKLAVVTTETAQVLDTSYVCGLFEARRRGP